MKHTIKQIFSRGLFLVLITLSYSIPALAANECRVYYKYSTSSGQNSVYVNLNAGQTKNIDRNQVLYVQNKKQHKVTIKVTNMTLTGPSGTKWVTLPKSPDMDPPSGFGNYPPNIKLYQIKCQANSAPSSSQNTTSSYGSAIQQATIQNSNQVKRTFFNIFLANIRGGSMIYPLHKKYIRTKLGRVALSKVLVVHTNFLPPNIAFGDCNTIYFGNNNIVNKLKSGAKQTALGSDKLLVLHALGHVDQCKRVGLPNYAVQWYDRLPSTMVGTVTAVTVPSAHAALGYEPQIKAFVGKWKKTFPPK